VKAYLAQGNEGIYLSVTDGRDLFIGSQRADEFSAALRTWKRE